MGNDVVELLFFAFWKIVVWIKINVTNFGGEFVPFWPVLFLRSSKQLHYLI